MSLSTETVTVEAASTGTLRLQRSEKAEPSRSADIENEIQETTDNIQTPLSDKSIPIENEVMKATDNIKTFTDKYEERKWAKAQLAAAFRVFAKLGFNDGAGGHISLRDPVDPNLFWINPYAKHFSKMNVSDLVLVNEHGQILSQTTRRINRAGFIIHSTLHQMRPDVNAACHTHSPYGRAWSAFGRPIEMLVQDSCYFYNDLSVYKGFGGVVFAKEEGVRIGQALGPKNKSIILQNHGILTCGGTVAEAAALFIILERACQTQLLIEAAAANGLPKTYIGDAEAEYTKTNDCGPTGLYMAFQPEYEAILEETEGSFLD